MFRAPLLALGAAALLAVACGTESPYPGDGDGDDFDLEAMTLAESDLPEGYLQQDARSFDNQQWAEAIDQDDPEAKLNQLDAQGRVTGSVTIFAWDSPIEHLGRPYQITTHSTLFGTEKEASTSLRTLCDLPLDEMNPIRDIRVPRIGNESTAFAMEEEIPNFGKSLDTVVCFRTGRIVHAIVQSGLEGTQDLGLSIRLARHMLRRIDEVFAARDGDGRAANGDKDEDEDKDEG